jgi:glycosyltransferase involved in cell wall biosynthesis
MKEVSVIVPNFNSGFYLRDAVLSLLAVGDPDLEILVVDDGSTDGSIESIREFPVRVIEQENRGVAAARNAGVRASVGEFITFLDSDDILVAEGLSLRREYLRRNQEEWAVGGVPSTLIDGNAALIVDLFDKMTDRFEFPLLLDMDFYRRGNFFPVGSWAYLYRRGVFEKVGPYDESLRIGEDCDLHFRLLQKRRIPVLAVPVIHRRVHAGNVSLQASERGPFVLRGEAIEAVKKINAKYGLEAGEPLPWETPYL